MGISEEFASHLAGAVFAYEIDEWYHRRPPAETLAYNRLTATYSSFLETAKAQLAAVDVLTEADHLSVKKPFQRCLEAVTGLESVILKQLVDQTKEDLARREVTGHHTPRKKAKQDRHRDLVCGLGELLEFYTNLTQQNRATHIHELTDHLGCSRSVSQDAIVRMLRRGRLGRTLGPVGISMNAVKDARERLQ
jgi:hypothetical protein